MNNSLPRTLTSRQGAQSAREWGNLAHIYALISVLTKPGCVKGRTTKNHALKPTECTGGITPWPSGATRRMAAIVITKATVVHTDHGG